MGNTFNSKQCALIKTNTFKGLSQVNPEIGNQITAYFHQIYDMLIDSDSDDDEP